MKHKDYKKLDRKKPLEMKSPPFAEMKRVMDKPGETIRSGNPVPNASNSTVQVQPGRDASDHIGGVTQMVPARDGSHVTPVERGEGRNQP